MRVLELGSYLAPAYAGMILAEQGHQVVKWWAGTDPILGLEQGDELWAWVNHGKEMLERRVDNLERAKLCSALGRFDGVIDNIRPATWERWGLDPAWLAEDCWLPWVSIRDDFDRRSFDAIAQARSWLEYGPWLPIYLGDTALGLWAAFKLTSMAALGRAEHAVIRQAAALQKLVEGELVVDAPIRPGATRFDVDTYTVANGVAVVDYRGERVVEPVRDRAWKLANLDHVGGRLVV